MLNWKTNATQAGFFVAKARGYYEEQGLAVEELVDGRGGNFAAKQVGLEEHTFGLGDAAAVLAARAKDLPVRSYATSQQKSDGVIYTVREVFGGELTHPKQLAGKTIACPKDSPITTLAKALVERAGVRDRVTFLGVAPEQQTPNLLSGNADAAIAIFNSPIALERKGYDASSIRLAEYMPTVGRTVIARPPFAEDNPEAVRAFLRATARGWAWAANNPEGAMDVMVDAKPSLAKSREMGVLKVKYSAKHLISTRSTEEHGWGWQPPDDWSTVRDALVETGFVPSKVRAERAFTNDLLDTGYPYIGGYADEVSIDYDV